jgi:dihydrolipoamide dehydrogenase
MKTYDVLIVGAGTAGLAAAKVLRDRGADYAIVEEGQGGTLCATTGCMPSKALIAAAKLCHGAQKFPDFGIEGADGVRAALPQVLARVRAQRDHFANGARRGMETHPIIRGRGHLTTDVNTVMVGETAYSARAVILCTGSAPRVPKALANLGARALTTDTLFEQKDLPRRMAVVGLGSVGAEMAQALARLGVEVVGLSRSERIAGLSDPAVNTVAQEILGDEITLHTNAEITGSEVGDDGTVVLHTNQDGRVEVGGVLVAAGRVPRLSHLGLEAAGIPVDETGMPSVDPHTLRVYGPGRVYLAGDANGQNALQHEAAAEGRRAALDALGEREIPLRPTPLAITFTDPPIVQLGQSFPEAHAAGALLGEAPYDTQSRAVLEGRNRGLARLYGTREGGQLTGATLMAPAADHMGHMLMVAVAHGLTAAQVLNMPIYHPVLEEGLRRALSKIAHGTG